MPKQDWVEKNRAEKMNGVHRTLEARWHAEWAGKKIWTSLGTDLSRSSQYVGRIVDATKKTTHQNTQPSRISGIVARSE